MDSALLKKTCAEAAKFLASHVTDSFEPELTHACSNVLLDIAEYADSYEGKIEIGSLFLKEFRVAMSSMEQIKKVTRLALHDWIFNLFEALAILTREETLRNNNARPAQAEAMRYFTKSGHWLPEDATLVAEYFYRKLSQLLTDNTSDKNV